MPTHKHPKQPQHVVITKDPDHHVPFVQKHMADELFLVDPQAVIGGRAKLSLSHRNGVQHVHYDVHYGDACLSRVRSVWYRKPDYSIEALPVADVYREYSETALRGHLSLLTTRFDEAFWISRVAAIRQANDKQLQLKLAQHIARLS